MEVLEKEAVEDLFRFAFLLTGKRAEAVAVVSEALGEAEVRATQFRAERARWVWTARWVWGALRKKLSTNLFGDDLDPDLVPFFFPLAAQERAALALRSISHIETLEIAQILNQRPNDLRKLLGTMHDARQALGMDELVLRDGVSGIVPSAEERSALIAAKNLGKTARGGRWERILGVAAVAFGVVFIVGFFFWERWKSERSSPLYDQVARLLEFNENSNLAEFEPFDANTGQLSDWLYLHGMEAVKIPAPLGNLKLVAGRVGQWRGMSVAQLISEHPKAVILVADVAGFSNEGMQIQASELSSAGWSVRWQVSGRHLVLLGVPGAMKELDAVFTGLEK
ncbi:MAG: hypothetical protein WCO60_02070 [Verrucomicrobiota bacterium]